MQKDNHHYYAFQCFRSSFIGNQNRRGGQEMFIEKIYERRPLDKQNPFLSPRIRRRYFAKNR